MVTINDLNKLVTTRGYGGGRGMAESGTTLQGINRRVEAILFTFIDGPSPREDEGW
jgi:hypothetical protein